MVTVNQASTALPLGLTTNAVRQFPQAEALAYSLEADKDALDPVKDYLVRKSGFSELQAKNCITEYQKYLVLVTTTNEAFAPSEDADAAWHAHILHTRLYAPYCERHFGRFIHHVPSGPDVHPPEEFFVKQNQIGKLFFGKATLYTKNGTCNNSHSCHHGCMHNCTVHDHEK